MVSFTCVYITSNLTRKRDEKNAMNRKKATCNNKLKSKEKKQKNWVKTRNDENKSNEGEKNMVKNHYL